MDIEPIIEEVYEAFSDAEKPMMVEGCPCCMTAEEYETLTSKPIRDLTVDELSKYASAALLTLGTPEDYQYFLPRILELSIEDSAEWITSIEVTARKMSIAGFPGWSEGRRRSIDSLWSAQIVGLSSSELSSFEIDSWLGAATFLPIPVEPLLVYLDGNPEIIAELRSINALALFKGKLEFFQDDQNDGLQQIIKWLRP